MKRFLAIPNDDGHFDFMEVDVRSFSYRYKSLLGVEGKWNGDTRQFTLRAVIVGLTVGVTGGVSIGTDAE